MQTLSWKEQEIFDSGLNLKQLEGSSGRINNYFLQTTFLDTCFHQILHREYRQFLIPLPQLNIYNFNLAMLRIPSLLVAQRGFALPLQLLPCTFNKFTSYQGKKKTYVMESNKLT